MPLTREQVSARIESIARRVCRTPRLVNIDTQAFRRAEVAVKRLNKLAPRGTARFLVRTMPRSPVNSHEVTK